VAYTSAVSATAFLSACLPKLESVFAIDVPSMADGVDNNSAFRAQELINDPIVAFARFEKTSQVTRKCRVPYFGDVLGQPEEARYNALGCFWVEFF
jgi:hypothetical protein